MNVILLCKISEATAGIATYLNSREHRVTRTDERVSGAGLALYDIGISYNYRHILKQDQIDAVKLGIVNFHTGLLPEQRGANPNVWALLQGKGGCTAHFVDKGIDTGPIIVRTPVEIEKVDTSATYYDKLQRALENQFYDLWPIIEACGEKGYRVPSHEQPNGYYDFGGDIPNLYGTHKVKDLEELDRLNEYDMRVVDKLRSRTFHPYESCYYLEPNGEKVFYDIVPWKKR